MSGFLRGHSCATALIKMTDDLRRALHQNKDVGVVTVDFSKAFDSICLNLLIAKLKAYGIQDQALQLMRIKRNYSTDMHNAYIQWSKYKYTVVKLYILYKI